MAQRNEVLALLARLTAANPSFRVPAPTAELWCQKLEPLKSGDVAQAVESFIEKGGRVPSIGDVLSKARTIGSERTRREQERAALVWEPTQEVIGNRSDIYARHFEIGRERAEAGQQRSITESTFTPGFLR